MKSAELNVPQRPVPLCSTASDRWRNLFSLQGASRSEDWLERHSTLAVAVLLTVTGCAILVDCWHRPFFYDELFTLHIARLASAREVVKALLSGADDHPPLDYLIRHFSLLVPGPTEITARLPTAAAYLAGLACFFVFVRRALGGISALLATAVSVLCYNEMILSARPYGILVGISAGMLLSWQDAKLGTRRRVALTVLAFLSFVAPLLHYYGGLLAIPVVAGEVYYTWRRRRIDTRIWLALSAGAAALPILVPFIIRARIYAPGFWTFPQSGRMNLPIAYGELFWRLCIALLLAIVLWGVLRLSFKGIGQEDRPPLETLPEHAAGVALLLSPIWVFLLAVTVTNASSFHYSSQTVYGGGLLLAALVRRHKIFRWAFELALIPCLLSSLWDIASATDPFSFPPTMTLIAGHLLPFDSPRPSIESSRKSAIELQNVAERMRMPVVFGSAIEFIRLSYYSPDSGSHFTYLSDPALSLSFLRFDTIDLGMSHLAPFAKLNVVPYSEFVSTHGEFLLAQVDPRNIETVINWLPRKLAADGARCEAVDHDHPHILVVRLKK